MGGEKPETPALFGVFSSDMILVLGLIFGTITRLAGQRL